MTIKKLLNEKIERELERERENKLIPIMNDFSDIILNGNYCEEDVKIMLQKKDLLAELTEWWQNDIRVEELQRLILKDFLQFL